MQLRRFSIFLFATTLLLACIQLACTRGRETSLSRPDAMQQTGNTAKAHLDDPVVSSHAQYWLS